MHNIPFLFIVKSFWCILRNSYGIFFLCPCITFINFNHWSRTCYVYILTFLQIFIHVYVFKYIHIHMSIFIHVSFPVYLCIDLKVDNPFLYMPCCAGRNTAAICTLHVKNNCCHLYRSPISRHLISFTLDKWR